MLVVDGGGSHRCALLGDNIAEMGYKNGWSVSPTSWPYAPHPYRLCATALMVYTQGSRRWRGSLLMRPHSL